MRLRTRVRAALKSGRVKLLSIIIIMNNIPSREAVEWNFDFYSIANKFIMKEKMMAVCISIMVYSGDGC